MLQEPSPDAPVPFGRFELIRRIGAGGMGEVFLAKEHTPGGVRARVVKKVLPQLSENKAFVGRFLDESRVVVRLKHDNIARVYAMGDVDGEYFLAMEYVKGKTVSRLTKRLREQGRRVPVGLAVLLCQRVCEGLAHAHAATDEKGAPLKLVHRDLSPANVCVSYEGFVKIIDFGAAHSTLKQELTAPRIVIGNLTYMAPEQAKKHLVDGRADVYSVGVMLWELLTWNALPSKGDPVERWRKAAYPRWESPSSIDSSVPEDLSRIVMQALAINPAERYPGAAAFGHALKTFLVRHHEGLTEKELGEVVSTAFEKEKDVEENILKDALAGKSDDETPLVPKRKVTLAPPTAMAFEHTAIVPPEQLLAEVAEAEALEAASGGTPTPRARPHPRKVPLGSVDATLTGFGVRFDELGISPAEPRFLREADATLDEDGELFPVPTRKRAPPRDVLTMTLGALVFCAAVGLGFACISWWLDRGPK